MDVSIGCGNRSEAGIVVSTLTQDLLYNNSHAFLFQKKNIKKKTSK
jgi:hypothetical protein